MFYRLLGDLEIGRDGQPLSLRSGHDRIVLAALLVSPNRQLRKEDLMRVAWTGEPVQEAQLHKVIASLRAVLAAEGRRDELSTHPRLGYEIKVAPADLDMLMFQKLLRDAEAARARRDSDGEMALLREAMALWRGPRALANVPERALQRERERLERDRRRAAERLFDIEIARGHHDRVLRDLETMAGAYPADGRLCEQLLIATYQSGHATDAISAFERHAEALEERTGGAPAPALRDLHYAIASGNEPAIAAAQSVIVRRAGVAPAPAVHTRDGQDERAPVPRQLPPDPVDLVSRDDLLAEASWLLGREPGRRPPVIVITGPGGIGKTAMAVRVAHDVRDHYPDGQLYIELRDPTGQPADPAEVLAQFLRAFGRTVPEQLGERVSLYRTLMADRRVLVVLDDAAGGAQIRDLIPASPGCGILTTSRQRMPEVSGAHHVAPLGPLDRSDAIELFLRVVRGSGSLLDLAAELADIERVAELCAGLPLALRIAAMLRVRDHPRLTGQLADRLARQGPAALTYREQSVARTIGAGLDRLDGSARRLFLGLGLLRLPGFGPWTAAALLAGPGNDPDAALSELADSNMVEFTGPGFPYRFHALTREYAARRANGADLAEAERAAMPGRAYQALLTLARHAHAALYGGDFEVIHSDVPDWAAPRALLAEIGRAPVEWFEQERLNIRAAVSHCANLGLTAICWDLAVSAHEFYTVAGYHDDWYATHSAALAACRDAGDSRGEGIVLACLGQPALIASRSGLDRLDQLERSVHLMEEHGGRHGHAIALRTLANALRRRGHLAEPLALFGQALAGYAASGDTVGQWQAQRFIGQTYLDDGDPAAALRELGTALRIAQQLGTARPLAQTRYWLGQACLAAGDLDAAYAAFTAVRDVFGEPAGLGHAYAVHGLGDVARQRGDTALAATYLELAARLAHEETDVNLEGRVAISAAWLHERISQDGPRVEQLEKAVACFVDCHAAGLEAEALAQLGRAHQEAGRSQDAQAAWSRVADLYAQMQVSEADRLHHPPSGLRS